MPKQDYCPLISVIVPVYNIRDYVGRCVESITVQSYTKLEIILVDDGSTDGSGKICDEWAVRDGRIQVLHSQNGGQVRARKNGANLSSGDYILNVDGDDWIEKDRVLCAVEHLQTERYDMLYMGGYIQDFHGKSELIQDDFEEISFTDENVKNVFAMLQSPCHAFERTFRTLLWQWCISRELCLTAFDVDDSISMCEDVLGIWQCALRARSFCAFKNPSYHYVQRAGSLSWSYDPREWERMRLLKDSLIEAVMSSAYRKIPLVMDSVVKACFMSIAISDYSLMLKGSDSYLFPFPAVRHGSRIIIYGAGKLGFHICNAVKKCSAYEVVMICDRNCDRPPVCGYKVMAPSAIRSIEFDFVLVAVIYAKMAGEIRNLLLAVGVPVDKIALMDAAIMDEKSLHRIYEDNNP